MIFSFFPLIAEHAGSAHRCTAFSSRGKQSDSIQDSPGQARRCGRCRLLVRSIFNSRFALANDADTQLQFFRERSGT
jgi:hypothetical protein